MRLSRFRKRRESSIGARRSRRALVLRSSKNLKKARNPARKKEKEKKKNPAALARPNPLNITITKKGKRKITVLMDLDEEEKDEPLQWPLKAESEPKIEAKGP